MATYRLKMKLYAWNPFTNFGKAFNGTSKATGNMLLHTGANGTAPTKFTRLSGADLNNYTGNQYNGYTMFKNESGGIFGMKDGKMFEHLGDGSGFGNQVSGNFTNEMSKSIGMGKRIGYGLLGAGQLAGAAGAGYMVYQGANALNGTTGSDKI